ncbi:MAG: PIG-L family deacetylase [Planctomycetes bacterium]|nr:PIG-L family deacetylase [Planctomycetota bacterium]
MPTFNYPRFLAGVLVLAVATRAGAVGDVLIVAPHPDDEVIGCAGVILRAVEEKKRATVVVLTNGDGYVALAAAVAKKKPDELAPDDFMKAGALRQEHSASALKRLGVPHDDLMFLGYPDGGLETMWRLDGSAVFQQILTQQRETYGLIARDYHSLAHGSSALYVKSSVVADLAEIIRARKPREVFVSHESDKHGDHRAAFWLALEASRKAAFQGRFLSYVVHGDPLPQEPNMRLKLTPQEYETKKAALLDHTTGTSPVHDGLVREYLKSEELFWEFSIR